MSGFKLPWESVIDGVVKVADDLITTDKEQFELELKAQELDQRLDLAQIEVNKEQARHPSIFVAGPRPAIMWVGVAGLGYQFVLYPFLLWGWALAQALGWINPAVEPPPILDLGALITLLVGLLGLGGYRTFEKVRGVETTRIDNIKSGRSDTISSWGSDRHPGP